MLTYTTRKDGTIIAKEGRYKVLEIFKRPHGGYCCYVIEKGRVSASNGYHATALPTLSKAKAWGEGQLRK